MGVAFDVRETSASDSEGSVRLIDLTEEGPEAPFAVREADGSTGAVPGRIPDKAEMLAWLEKHPVVVGIATGVLCFSIIAAAMSTVLGSDSNPDTDDPAAGAALSETDGGQGSFSSSGSGGANFTSDESKLSRSGAGKVADEQADGEAAAGAGTNAGNGSNSSARNSQSTDPTTVGPSNLDQRATIGGRSPAAGNGSGQATGSPSSTSRPAGTSGGVNLGPTTAGNTPTTRNLGPNASGPVPTTATTNRATSAPATNPTTVSTAGQASSTSPSTAPTTAASTPTTAPTTGPTTPTTPSTAPPPPAALMIAAPSNGSSHSFETATNFAANFIAGATEYCWTFIQSGSTKLSQCSAGTSYQLPARPSGLGPGLVTVTVTATGSFGPPLTDSIQISLYRTKVINNPTQNLEIGRSPLRVGVVNLTGATQYCFRLTQSGYNSGELCYSTPGNTFNKNDPIWDSLSPGPLTVSAKIYGGGILLASDSVTIQLL